MNHSFSNKVIILLGPTAVGKTGLSIHLAKSLNTEIISADSMLVYRYMDIGTAKPSAEELNAVPHHLIDILHPGEKFSVGMFRERAVEIINSLHSKNKIPIIAGGTGLYIRSLTAGLFDGPGADEELRAELKKEEKVHGGGYLYSRLKELDPSAAEKLEANDLRRIIRALEVCLKSGKEISGIQREETAAMDYEYVKIGLTRDRKELYGIIDGRVDSMIREGLLEETKRLLEMNPAATAMQALGYKEMALHIDGAISFEEAVEMIKKRTRNYAKRQFTWFRKEPDVMWVNITGIFDSQGIFTKVVNDVTILEHYLERGEP